MNYENLHVVVGVLHFCVFLSNKKKLIKFTSNKVFHSILFLIRNLFFFFLVQRMSFTALWNSIYRSVWFYFVQIEGEIFVAKCIRTKTRGLRATSDPYDAYQKNRSLQNVTSLQTIFGHEKLPAIQFRRSYEVAFL